jgi:hypothetical protein
LKSRIEDAIREIKELERPRKNKANSKDKHQEKLIRGMKNLLKVANGADALLTSGTCSSIEQQVSGCLAELLKA